MFGLGLLAVLLTAAMPTAMTAITAITAAPAAASPAAAPACGDTLTRDTSLRRDLVCTAAGVKFALRLRPGVLLDLGGYTITVTGTKRAVIVSALGGQGSTTEIRNGSIVGGRGISLTGTDDEADAGRQQRLRVNSVDMRDADLDVTDASARLFQSTMIRPVIRMRHGLLDVVRSALTDVDADAVGGVPDPRNTWNVTNASVSGTWWSSGDTHLANATVIDTSEAGSRTPVYGDLIISKSSNLQGPVYPVTALDGEHTITDSKIDRSGGFVVNDLLTVSGSTLRRIGPLDSGPTGTTVVVDSDFNTPNAASLVRGQQVQVSNSTVKAAVGVAISGDTVSVTGTVLRGGKGADTVVARALTASGNTLLNNAGTGLRAQGGPTTVTGNVITNQGGDGIRFDTFADGTAATGPFQVQNNQVRDGLGWGIRTADGTGSAVVVDLGGNVASGNAAGQCSPPITCSAR